MIRIITTTTKTNVNLYRLQQNERLSMKNHHTSVMFHIQQQSVNMREVTYTGEEFVLRFIYLGQTPLSIADEM